ncbi:hypothetical protein GS501_00125 [Saccharibacter sp. 17.LH.SD]|uniref:helix-turn-helix domain-containing protein n=1 Tax=Saccharibacter sp. 17.LH.SD TaxID=2689393 RepID=UPI001367A832|nr:helix-turn-helix domain-containing protein [Saccharibacter sp. 17.LH.SD]MXV43487.1 hypothetical protein [Saccharibacter sp. 17.LH.SD]
MSYSAMKWARHQQLPTSEKFVLFIMADCAREGDNVSFPSLKTLVADTGMSERTIQRARKALVRHGLIVREPRYGQSGFRLCFDVMVASESVSDTKNDTRTVNSDTVSETPSPCHPVTVSPLDDTVSPQNDTVSPPPNHHITTIEPEYIPPISPKPKKSAQKFAPPDWVPLEAWAGWVEMRRAKKRPATQRALELSVKELAKLRDAGNDPGEVLDQSTQNGWQGLFPIKGRSPQASKPQSFVTTSGNTKRSHAPSNPFEGFGDDFDDELPELPPEYKSLCHPQNHGGYFA